MLQRSRGWVKKTMTWYGKLIGAILGAFMTHNWIGAIVGMFIGHQFDRAASSRESADGAAQSSSVLRSFARPSRRWGTSPRLTGSSPNARSMPRARRCGRFALNDAQVRTAIELYTAGKRADFPLDDTIRQFRGLASRRPDLCRVFVQIQLEAALQGGGLGAVPRAILERICAHSGRIAAGVRVARGDAAHARRPREWRWPRSRDGELGSTTRTRCSASRRRQRDAEVKKAYRRLMSQNHPDKLVANGLPESMIAAAHERTQRILEAYELIRERRGIR